MSHLYSCFVTFLVCTLCVIVYGLVKKGGAEAVFSCVFTWPCTFCENTCRLYYYQQYYFKIWLLNFLMYSLVPFVMPLMGVLFW